MIDNPFSSETFAKIWIKHFNAGQAALKPDFLDGVSFVKKKFYFLPVFVNAGSTHTKGISYYPVSADEAKDYLGRCFLIYDVPGYFKVPDISDERLGIYRVRQYPGFSINLKNYADFDDYLKARFSKNGRYKLKKFRKRLEQSFDIRYQMHWGDLSKDEFDFIFQRFHALLEKRFAEKGITNNNLDPEEWQFYREVAYPMILEKKAALFVVYHGEEPIGVTLNYFSENVLFDAITVFDIDYSKFHLGSVMLMKMIEWAMEQKLKVFDFSKGHFDYKTRWSDTEYDFEYHILYDRGSAKARFSALFLKAFFKLKQELREKRLNEVLHKITFVLRGKKSKDFSLPSYHFSEPGSDIEEQNLAKIARDAPEFRPLRSAFFEFLYLNNERYEDLTVYRLKDANQQYLLRGNTKAALITLKP